MSEYLGCGNHSCRIEKPKGMGTNAGCSCLDGLPFEQRSKIIRAFDCERKRAENVEALLDGKNIIVESLVSRIKRAEEERDALARAFNEECPRDYHDRPTWCDFHCSEEDVEADTCGCSYGEFRCWLKWAANEAAKRGSV